MAIEDKIQRKAGEGTFGQVLECWDREARETVAIKVVRTTKKYREAVMLQIDVLHLLGKYDRNGSRQCDLRLIHSDLKPENILFVSPECKNTRLQGTPFIVDVSASICTTPFIVDVSASILTTLVPSISPTEGARYKRLPKSSTIKVIDFGSTAYGHHEHNCLVSTRHYRAPEVILGLGWSYPCDIWSVGCILVELFLGEALFQTHKNLEHLAMMERVLGPFPQRMLRRADRHAEKYVRRGRLKWLDVASSRESIKAVMKLPRLQ
ncbi:hypothetical protein GH714_043882 [Hevea brasiliensis]|uniref:Protein kinase domain-containing protein n=1 Tax=Hevea brasiliensis TaxID=3981 RepID=A0A6A6K0A0_HEVBR|nr:hypothetical protein GH714_043882 [Hevea brasiliensis]